MERNILSLMFRRLLEALRFERKTRSVITRDPLSVGKQDIFQLTVDGIKISGKMFFPNVDPPRLYPVVVICHGIPGSGEPRPVDDPGYEGLAGKFTGLGFASVVFNFRGCGDSGGDFDMLGWTRDLESVLAHISNTPYVDPSRIIIVGFSGGGAAAIYVSAHEDSVYGLAVVGTPASFSIFRQDPAEIVNDFKRRGIIRNPDFPKDVQTWMKHFEEIEPLHWIAHFKGEHLAIVHGEADELVPVDHATQMYSAAPEGITELFLVPGGKHRLRLDDRCVAILESWLVKTVDTRLS